MKKKEAEQNAVAAEEQKELTPEEQQAARKAKFLKEIREWVVALVVALVVGLGVFAFLSTGGRGGMSKWGRSLSEMTGGLFGKKPPRE